MRHVHFSFPAAYQRHVEAVLERTLREIGNDLLLREDEDARVQGYAPVPDDLIDPELTGRVRVLFVPNREAVLAARPTDLRALGGGR